MARIVLGKRPETVSLTAQFEMLDGSKSGIKVEYKYRTRSEYAEFVKEFGERKGGSDASGADDPDAINIASWIKKLDEGRADFIMEIAQGWDLADEFNRENVVRLIDEFPAGADAIINTYRLACLEGRRGN